MDLINAVKNAGIVGAGGAGFPTHIKAGSKAEYIIANGAECEPLLDKDKWLMTKHTEKILNGFKLLIENTGAKKGFFGVKNKYKDVIKKITELLPKFPMIEVYQFQDSYPAGDEQIMVYEILKRIVPEGGIPLDVGCVVSNVETMYNISEAAEDKPVTTKWITVNGAVNKPFTAEVPVGITYNEVLKKAGNPSVDDFAVIDGGPMMGFAVENLDNPIDKRSAGLIVLPKHHYLVGAKTLSENQMTKMTFAVCTQCRMCTDLCSRYLIGHDMQPHLIMRAMGYINFQFNDSIVNDFLCSECGICTYYACPMGLPPQQINQMIKKKLREKGIRFEKNNKELTAHPLREYRLVPSKRLVDRLNLHEYYKLTEYIGKIETDKVKIPLMQHIGAPAVPIVNVGDKVKKGDKIGEIPENSLGASVHSSISGTITKIDDSYIYVEIV